MAAGYWYQVAAAQWKRAARSTGGGSVTKAVTPPALATRAWHRSVLHGSRGACIRILHLKWTDIGLRAWRPFGLGLGGVMLSVEKTSVDRDTTCQ
jgi:hypothetical protein